MIEYSECHCIQCKERTMRFIGNEIDRFDDGVEVEKALFKCEKCGQMAYVDVEWIFEITIPRGLPR